MTIDEKIDLILQTVRDLTQMETRGNLLAQEHEPKEIKIVYSKDDDFSHTEIQLVFPDGSIGEPGNWSGIGDGIEDSLRCNLICLRYELNERIEKLKKSLELVKLAAPIEGD